MIKINAIYNLPDDEIEETIAWWKDNQFIKELDYRYDLMESGKDKGITLSQIEGSIEKLRKKKYGY